MFIDVNNTTLFYKVQGSGSPLILLHGNGEDHTIFDEITQKLKNDFTVYAIDSRNHGQSAKTDDFSYDAMAQDIFEFINKLSLGKVNIVGFSDGAIITLKLALKNSEIIEKMVLLGINLKPTDFNERSYDYIKNHYEKTKDPLYKLMLEEPNIELDDIKDVHIPTFLVAAEKEIYKPETYPNILKAMPNAKLKIMPGHKHETYIVNQDILYPDLIEFFNK